MWGEGNGREGRNITKEKLRPQVLRGIAAYVVLENFHPLALLVVETEALHVSMFILYYT